jgi:hypothetical protein
VSQLTRLAVCALLAFGCAADPSPAQPEPSDASPFDEDPVFDGGLVGSDVARVDGSQPTPGAELCNNALDDDGDGRVDEGCPCVPGSTQRCYAGRPVHAGVGLCALGTMRCTGTGEFGVWSLCQGSRLPVGDACDGVDNDCDGRIDNNCLCPIGARQSCYTGPIGTGGVGACRSGMRTCSPWVSGYGSVWSLCTGETRPARDVCDGVDNDCNGTVDDGCACTPGASRACYGGPAGTMNVGACRGGRQSCAMTTTTPAWGACAGQTLPRAEVCGDGVDNDCNGRVDDGCECTLGASRPCYAGPAGTQNVGACRDGRQTCIAGPSGGTTWDICRGWMGPTAEVCDNTDNDCNRATDEGCACRPGTTQSCYTGPAGTAGRGTCLAGTQTCLAGPRGVGAAWSSCAGQALPGVEVCNRADDDCDGMADEGLSCSGPTVMCPPPQTAPAGSTVTLTATSSTPAAYLWEVVSPPGALYTLGGAAALSTTFTSVIVGTYTLRFTATDAMGRAASCMTSVTMQGHGLRVEMTWDTDGNDVDLHVHNSAATMWFDAVNDCYFRNRRPEWDAVGPVDNPALDTDDTNGRGPENIRVDEPPTTQTYSVGVHYWSGMAPSNVTVRVYCGDRLAAPAFVRSMQGGDGMTNDFWRVARVRFTSPTACTVTPVNDVVQASAARTGSP